MRSLLRITESDAVSLPSLNSLYFNTQQGEKMSQYAVLHITKYKELGGIGAHIDRLHVPENANPEKVGFNENLVEYRDATLLDILGDTIDKEKTYLNHLHNTKPTQSLSQDVWKRIKEGHTVTNKSGKIETIRKDAVLALGIILTGSPERMEEIEADKKLFKAWKKANYDFACKLFTKENIVRFTLHIDEKTPHFHCVVVPINKEGRLSARSFINGSRQLRRIQDQYADAMASFGLERGIYAELTHSVHVKPSVYARKINQDNKESEVVSDKITWRNAANLSTVKQEVSQQFKELNVLVAEHADKARREEVTNKSLIDKHQVKAFEKALEQSAGRSYDWIKTNIEMIPFLTQELGWTIDKSKGQGSYVKLKHPVHGKIFARTEPLAKTGHWVFSRENGGGGTLINLLEDAGWDASRIRSLASGEYIFSPVDTALYTPPVKKQYIEEDPFKQTQKAQKYLDTVANVTKHPLLEDRAIEIKTYQNLEGLKVSGQTAAFALYKDFDNVGKARLCSTIRYYKDRFGSHEKRFQAELPRGLSILKEKGLDVQNATRIVITESPVDALSYRQLVLKGEKGWKTVKADAFGTPGEADLDKTVLISTCGNLIDGIKNELEQLFELAAQNNQLVALALDNDAAGIHMRETLACMLENAGCNYLIEVPKYGKDWNEILMQGSIQLIEADAAVIKEIAQDQWELFEESAYATSLLNAIGIEESTYHAFQPHTKVSEKAMVMALYGNGTSSNEIIDTWTLQGDSAKGKKFETSIHAAATPALFVLQGDLAKADQIVLVASPIDALVHYQNQDHKDGNTAYLYAHANTKAQLEGILIDFVRQANVANVVLTANSKNSHLLKDMEEVLQQQELAYTHTLVEVREPQRQLAASKSWQVFEEKPYAGSLLQQLGIEKTTSDAFKDTIKADEKTIMVALREKNNQNKEDVQATWSLQWDRERGIRVHAQKSPILSVLKGDVTQAKQVVLVVSPMDALVHYQTQAHNDDTCYIHVDASSKEAAQEPLQQFKKFARQHDVNISIARYGHENAYLAKRVQYLLKEDHIKAYTHRMKKEIPLVPFLTEQIGWIVDTQASDDQKAILTHSVSGEQINVPLQAKPSGEWVYTDAKGEEGNIVDVMLDQKWSWQQIIAFASSKFLPPIEVIDESRIEANYSILTTRDIEKETFEHLSGIKANLKEAVFDLYKDFDSITGEASLCSHITYAKDKDGNNSRYADKGMPRGISVVQEQGQTLKEANTLIVTNTPIDALSYRQLSAREDFSWKHVRKATQQATAIDKGQQKTAYLSTSGYITTSMYEDFKQVAKLAKQDRKTVVVAFNADADGKSMARSLAYILKNEEVAYRVEVPTEGESWNEVLTQKRDPHHIADNNHINLKQWAALEKNPYEESILERLGIDKNTYEAFNKNLKVNEEFVMMALEEPNKAEIAGIWSIRVDPVKGIQEHIDLANMPCVAVIKGDLQKAQQIMLVASPLDALINYNREMSTIKEMQALNRPEQVALAKERLAKIENTAYVYVEARLEQKIEAPLTELLKLARAENKELVIASGKGAEKLLQVIEPMLQKQNYKYTKEKIELPAVGQKLTAGLGSGVELFGALASMNRNSQHEDEDEEEEDKNKKNRIRRGF